MCVREDLWRSVRDAAAICIVNVVGQQQEHQKQRNGAVSILVNRTQLHHCAVPCDFPLYTMRFNAACGPHNQRHVQ